MKPPPRWAAWLAAKQKEISGKLLTRAEFSETVHHFLALTDCPLKALHFAFILVAPYPSFEIGDVIAEGANKHTLDLKNPLNGKCEVSYLLKESARLDAQGAQDLLVAFIQSWWKPELRSDSAGLLDLKRNARVGQLADTTVIRSRRRGHRLSVFYCDLDNFKQINDTIDSATGDRVILEFGAIVDSAVAPYGIALHDGGDKFVVLCPTGGPLTAIRAAHAIFAAVRQKDFNIGDLKVGVSAGASNGDTIVESDTFQSLRSQADIVLKGVKQTQIGKGCLRFELCEQISSYSWGVRNLADLYKILTLSSLFQLAPFLSPWLNALSSIIRERINATGLDITSLKLSLDLYIEWMKPEQVNIPIPEGLPPDFVPSVCITDAKGTPLEFAYALCHGIITSAPGYSLNGSLSIKYSDDGLRAAVHFIDGDLIWASDDVNEPFANEVALSLLPIQDTKIEQNQGCRAILVKIGHAPLPVPAGLFSDIIVVDDRPTRGGCLPDFWEVTIGRFIASVVRNPNVSLVFVVGNQVHGQETVAQLRNINNWPSMAETMSARLAVSSDMVRQASHRLNGRIHFVDDYPSLIETLSNELANPLQVIARADEPHPRHPFLNRTLDLEKMALLQIDGCRVDTIADAFPVVLEIARKAAGPGIPLIRDQAGQALRELIDFKVVLKRPQEHKVPDYYLQQADRMETYFKKAFLDESQYFGRALKHPNQADSVIKHICHIIKQGEKAFATRRAILIVPHELGEGPELSPLGLVSIRIIPRFSLRRCSLSFSFTWRTVEALVGFPYSIYGSVRYSQHLTTEIQNLLPEDQKGKVTFDPLSYIAHSLHIFVDDFGQAIVRRIVNDATN
jgi:diguanylate cyclase (GGDEF)-like protein